MKKGREESGWGGAGGRANESEYVDRSVISPGRDETEDAACTSLGVLYSAAHAAHHSLRTALAASGSPKL